MDLSQKNQFRKSDALGCNFSPEIPVNVANDAGLALRADIIKLSPSL